MKKLTLAVIITTVLWGCSDFGSMNLDPNNPSTARTELLLTNAQRSLSSYVGAVTGTLYVQYIAETQYTDASRYGSASFDFSGWYSGPLQDLQTIIDLNTNEETRGSVLSGGSNANQIAVARILKTYYIHTITDRWGMVPYSEALKGKENLRPAYDAMPDIYESMLTELKQAVDQMDGGAGVKGDILFDGDMNKWAQFANSLRMRIALRMADSNNSSLAETEFADAYNAGMITEDVMYPYLAEATNENPWYSRFRTRTDYALSKPMADTLKAFDDMRAVKFGNAAPDADDGDGVTELNEIIGMPYGISNAGDITNSAISFPGSAIGAGGPGVGQQDAPLPIITTAELNFSLAEAAQRGWITGNAEDFYLQGIEDSWRQWDVYNATDYNNYISNAEIAYDPAQWEQKVGYQKWIALFPLGYEAWAEWRRLDYPQLTPAPEPLNDSGQIPVRQGYPSSEAELNAENYDAAVSAQGPDALDTALWWDVN